MPLAQNGIHSLKYCKNLRKVKRKSSGDLDSDSDEEVSKVKKPRKRILDSDSD